MERKGWRARLSRCFDKKAPPILQPIDDVIVELGGTTSAFNLTQDQVQSQKAPVSVQERIAELVEDNRRLAYEREYFDRLTENAMSILPHVVLHTEALSACTSKFVARVDRAKVRKEDLHEVRFGALPSPLPTTQRSSVKRTTKTSGMRSM